MREDLLVAALIGACVGAVVAAVVGRKRLVDPDGRLVRTNVSGRPVAAVLGDGLAAGGLLGLAGLLLSAGGTVPMGLAMAIVVGVMWAAGRADDLRGDEPDRGFLGHLRAGARGRVTGGVLKIVAGGIAGVAAGALVADGLDVLIVGITVALGANLFNLLDRAPGRAGKIWLLASAPLFLVGSETWAAAAGGTLGALVAVLPLDLGERGMLGDAGANAIGAVWGLGLAHSLPAAATVGAIVVLGMLNLASERVSFSAVIERTPLLKSIDRLGRK